MFGTNLDYMLLHPLTHDRNLQTEEEMGEVGEEDAFDLNDATARLSKLVARLDHRFPISSSLRYLDLACGLGDVPLLSLMRDVAMSRVLIAIPALSPELSWMRKGSIWGSVSISTA